MIKLQSKTLDLATKLYEGWELTSKSIETLTGLKNPRRAIHYLRSSGVKIKSRQISSVGFGAWRRRFVKVAYSIQKD